MLFPRRKGRMCALYGSGQPRSFLLRPGLALFAPSVLEKNEDIILVSNHKLVSLLAKSYGIGNEKLLTIGEIINKKCRAKRFHKIRE